MVLTGSEVQDLFKHAKANKFAIPAVNVIGSNSINATLETASKLNSPVIIQFSNGGAIFNAGKSLDNSDQSAAIKGAISGAKHVHELSKLYGATVILHTDHAARKLLPWIDGLINESEKNFKLTGKPIFSSHMIDLSEENIEDNIDTCCEYLKRMSAIDMTLEIELGVTGGEEDGVDNTGIDESKLYTQPEEVLYAYDKLSKISDKFTVAAAFGNVHGVYKPGNVKLKPVILKNSQDLISKEYNLGVNPIDFVFHGGSGSSVSEIREAIDYGAIKMNIDDVKTFNKTNCSELFVKPILKGYDLDTNILSTDGQILMTELIWHVAGKKIGSTELAQTLLNADIFQAVEDEEEENQFPPHIQPRFDPNDVNFKDFKFGIAVIQFK